MRNRFDQFARQMLRAVLSSAGTVETDTEVAPDAQRIGIWFVPDASRIAALRALGLLGRLGARACAMEALHATPSPEDLDACVRKHVNFRHTLSLREPPLPPPMQWVFSSGRPGTGLLGYGCRAARDWPRGTYLGPPRLRLGVVVVSELPAVRETLMIRLMGAGTVLRRAIADLRALSPDVPERRVALPILIHLREEIPTDTALQSADEQEFLLSTQDALELWEEGE